MILILNSWFLWGNNIGDDLVTSENLVKCLTCPESMYRYMMTSWTWLWASPRIWLSSWVATVCKSVHSGNEPSPTPLLRGNGWLHYSMMIRRKPRFLQAHQGVAQCSLIPDLEVNSDFSKYFISNPVEGEVWYTSPCVKTLCNCLPFLDPSRCLKDPKLSSLKDPKGEVAWEGKRRRRRGEERTNDNRRETLGAMADHLGVAALPLGVFMNIAQKIMEDE